MNLGLVMVVGTASEGYAGLGFRRSDLRRAPPLSRFSSIISTGYPRSSNFILKFSKCFLTNSSFEQIVFTVMACPYTIALKTCLG